MSLFPNFVGATKRKDEPAADTPAAEMRADDTHASASTADAARELNDDPIFNLLPPAETNATGEISQLPQPQGRNRHPVEMTDLSRLSIDRDGRLYWDGKPVEVHRRIAMSRRQIIAASIVAAFVVAGAIGAVLQGTLAASELMCRLGWSAGSCGPKAPARVGSDIPA